MPITYWVDVENRVIMATALGILADADLPLYLGAVTTDADVEPGFNELFDLREVTKVEITVSGIEDVADRVQGIAQYIKETKTAIVASNRNTAAVSSFYKILRTNLPSTIRLFRDMVAARAWLGLPEDRSAPRKQVRFAVGCGTGLHEDSASLVDLSLSGALLESKFFKPERGRIVRIQFPSFTLLGTVVRHTKGGFAIQFLGITDKVMESLREILS